MYVSWRNLLYIIGTLFCNLMQQINHFSDFVFRVHFYDVVQYKCYIWIQLEVWPWNEVHCFPISIVIRCMGQEVCESSEQGNF